MRIIQSCLLTAISAVLLFNGAQSDSTSRNAIVASLVSEGGSVVAMDPRALVGRRIVPKNTHFKVSAHKKQLRKKKQDEAKKTTETSSSSSAIDARSGDGTYYLTGLGSCGKTSLDTDLMVAMPVGQMKNKGNPNKNPWCGRFINAKGPNGNVTVELLDTCMGCQPGSLDFSPAAFAKLGNFEKGRIHISWEWA